LTEKQAEKAQQAIQGVAKPITPNTLALALDIFDEDTFEERIIAKDITDLFNDNYESYNDKIDC
jgi:hypothetical protein